MTGFTVSLVYYYENYCETMEFAMVATILGNC
ncbi:hypothetical protein cce_3067 [Crocosphaera subtropica ATCC 51142]|uniref:Uncharacterized protein n=1 Tax=Crocosphaera subtropica (strain ATCC 51142 / BH68) TaxID=43989 RepID=B1WWU6_CROS5|nr:hypothetical protein cce_3067 [Crocosphaera subtropica ATCC 51142]